MPTQASSAADTGTTTTSESYVFPTGVTVKLDCPRDTQRGVWDPSNSVYHYDVTCGSDCGGNDIIQIWAHSIAQCMQACDSYNIAMFTNTDIMCVGIAFQADIPDAEELSGNCFLKHECSVFQDRQALIAYALLVDSPFDSAEFKSLIVT